MDVDTGDNRQGGVPFKLVDVKREVRKGVVATSLQDLLIRARSKLAVDNDSRLKVVLELDGTEVDDDEYFCTMDNNTTLMVLINDEKWVPIGNLPSYRIIPVMDETDSNTCSRHQLEGLVDQLHGNLTHISMLGGKELELLMDMDPDSLADIIPDRIFLEHVKEASGRFLVEKRQAQDALELLKLYEPVPRPEDGFSKTEKI